MNIGNITALQVSNLVWATAARTLTSTLDGALTAENPGGQSSIISAAVQGTPGAYVQIVASTAHSVRHIHIDQSMSAASGSQMDIATGAGGSEVIKLSYLYNGIGTTQSVHSIPLDVGVIPKGVRVAMRTTNLGNASQLTTFTSVTLLEAND